MNFTNIEHGGAPGVASPWMLTGGMASPAVAPELKEIPVDLLSIRRLQGAQVSRIARFRGEIDLKAAAAADPDFVTREKKETSWG